eukprot:Gb_01544 [translate_table: standard]
MHFLLLEELFHLLRSKNGHTLLLLLAEWFCPPLRLSGSMTSSLFSMEHSQEESTNSPLTSMAPSLFCSSWSKEVEPFFVTVQLIEKLKSPSMSAFTRVNFSNQEPAQDIIDTREPSNLPGSAKFLTLLNTFPLGCLPPPLVSPRTLLPPLVFTSWVPPFFPYQSRMGFHSQDKAQLNPAFLYLLPSAFLSTCSHQEALYIQELVKDEVLLKCAFS